MKMKRKWKWQNLQKNDKKKMKRTIIGTGDGAPPCPPLAKIWSRPPVMQWAHTVGHNAPDTHPPIPPDQRLLPDSEAVRVRKRDFFVQQIRWGWLLFLPHLTRSIRSSRVGATLIKVPCVGDYERYFSWTCGIKYFSGKIDHSKSQMCATLSLYPAPPPPAKHSPRQAIFAF